MEFDGGPGPVRDRVLAIMEEWLGYLRELSGALMRPAGVDAERLAFELNAIGSQPTGNAS